MLKKLKGPDVAVIAFLGFLLCLAWFTHKDLYEAEQEALDEKMNQATLSSAFIGYQLAMMDISRGSRDCLDWLHKLQEEKGALAKVDTDKICEVK